MEGPGGEFGLKSGALLTAEQLEQLQKQAYEEGFEQGKSAGFEYGHKEALVEGRKLLEQRVQQFDELMQVMDQPLKILDEQVEKELVELVIAMVRQLIRREVKVDPGHIIGVVREALGVLPVSSRSVRLVLNPEDAGLIRQVFDVTDKELGWTIMEDPVMARGGCKVLTETSQIDATLESRLAALVAPLLGGERDEDSGEAD
jgi:flagellar assembly protein FliH